METTAMYFAVAVGVAVVYFFCFGFDRSGLGGKDRTFRSEVLESLIVGAVCGLLYWAIDEICARFGISSYAGQKLVTVVVMASAILIAAPPLLALRKWRKQRNRRLAKQEAENASMNFGPHL
jgi:hypothetical protein